MPGWLVLLAIQVAMFVIGRLLKPRVPRAKAAPFAQPKAEEGAAYPVIFGTQQVGMNLMFTRDHHILEEEVDAPGGGGQYTIFRYRMKVAGALCYGPLDDFHDFQFDERSLALQREGEAQSRDHTRLVVTPNLKLGPVPWTGDSPLTFDINARQMFGGQHKEGGVQGQARVYRGSDNQPIDNLVSYTLGDLASSYPWLAYVCFGADPDFATGADVEDPSQFYWVCNNPQPKAVSVTVGRFPSGVNGAETARIGRNANPIEMIYDVLTNGVWGRSWPSTRFDLPQLQAGCVTCFSENLGLSATLDDPRKADDFIDDVLSHIRGELVTDPLTGLIQIKLARAGDTPALVLNKDNCVSFKQLPPTPGKSVNHITVKYRRFETGVMGDVAEEIVALEAEFTLGVWLRYQAGSTNLTAAFVKINDVPNVAIPRPLGNDYEVNLRTGVFIFFPGDNINPGDKISIVYGSNPTFRGFVDGSVTTHNLGHRLIVGEAREETYDYPMFTDGFVAQDMAEFLLKLETRSLDQFEWVMTRQGSQLTPCDLVQVDEDLFRLAGVDIRVTQITYDHDQITCRGVEDVFGEPLVYDPGKLLDGGVTDPPVPGTAPAMGAIYCLGCAIRIGITAGDSFYNIEVQRATDENGTGATIISPAGGYPGSTLYFDDPQTIGTTWFYRARHIGQGAEPGPWTAFVSCTAAAGECGVPGCVDPTWQVLPTQPVSSGDPGRLQFVLLTDPQNRLISVEFQTQAANEGASGWIEASGPPYEATVPVTPGLISAIGVRVTYNSCAVGPTTFTQVFQYTLATAPPTGQPGSVTAVEVCVPLVQRIIQFEEGEVTLDQTIMHTEHHIRVRGGYFGAGRLTATIKESSLPSGAFVTAVYYDDAGVPQPMGPMLAVDAATVAGWTDGVMQGLVVNIADAAKQERRYGLRYGGGDGTGILRTGRIDLWLVAGSEDGGGGGEPQPECESYPFSLEQYTDTADLLANWTEVDPEGILTVELASHPDGGNKAIRLEVDTIPVTQPASVGIFFLWTGPIDTPFLPNTTYRLVIDTYILDNGTTFNFFDPVTGDPLAIGQRVPAWAETQTDSSGNFPLVANFNIESGTPGSFSPPAVVYADNYRVETLACDYPTPPPDPGGGGGGGGSGNPPPAAVSGGAVFNITGLNDNGYPGIPWNSSILKDLTPANAVSRLAAIGSNMRHLWMPQGPQGLWMPNGTFNKNLWIQSVRRWQTPGAARDAVLEAIASGKLRFLYLMDEPRHPTRYGIPGGIPLSDIKEMVEVALEVFPNLPILLRATPDSYDQEIPGLTGYWFALKANRLPVSNVEQHIARAAQLNAKLFVSINVRDFNDTANEDDAVSSNNADGWITTAQMNNYGVELASYEETLGLGMWWIDNGQDQWVTSQLPGMQTALINVWNTLVESHPDEVVGPPPPPPPGNLTGYFVTTSGASGNTGAQDSPWDFNSVVSGAHSIPGGTTVWIEQGSYSFPASGFRLAGTAANPVVLRAMPGARVIIEGPLPNTQPGSGPGGGSQGYVRLWGLEIKEANPLADVNIQANIRSPGFDFINCVFRDSSMSALGHWAEAPNAIIHGNIFLNSGSTAANPGLNKNHGIYSQNTSGFKRIEENVICGSGAYGVHLYASGQLGNMVGYTITGNVSFLNGRLVNSADFILAGDWPFRNVVMENNYTYNIDRSQYSSWVGAYAASSTQNQGLSYRNNYIVGLNIIENTWTGVTNSGNTVIGVGDSPADAVFVRPNGFESGRGHVIVYNWSGAGSKSANLSSILQTGDSYVIHSVLDLWGTPVASGTYAGGSVSIPMTAISPPTPAMGAPSMPTPGPEFGVFLVRKV